MSIFDMFGLAKRPVPIQLPATLKHGKPRETSILKPEEAGKQQEKASNKRADPVPEQASPSKPASPRPQASVSPQTEKSTAQEKEPSTRKDSRVISYYADVDAKGSLPGGNPFASPKAYKNPAKLKYREALRRKKPEPQYRAFKHPSASATEETLVSEKDGSGQTPSGPASTPRDGQTDSIKIETQSDTAASTNESSPLVKPPAAKSEVSTAAPSQPPIELDSRPISLSTPMQSTRVRIIPVERDSFPNLRSTARSNSKTETSSNFPRDKKAEIRIPRTLSFTDSAYGSLYESSSSSRESPSSSVAQERRLDECSVETALIHGLRKAQATRPDTRHAKSGQARLGNENRNVSDPSMRVIGHDAAHLLAAEERISWKRI